ncbi:hypothetical protein DFH28DRAFT_882902 [Melampsora americana]|nr:hypothetical protein DFH28DRAFT_882902 [Melampsora americana]
MSQKTYESCFAFSVPPGKPTDPAYADPTPILSNRDVGFKRHITTAVSSTSEPSSSSPFAFSISSESKPTPIIHHRTSLPDPSSHSHLLSSPKDHHPQADSKRIKLEAICWNKSTSFNETLTQSPSDHFISSDHLGRSSQIDEFQIRKPFCLQAAPTRKRPRRRFEEIERLYGCIYPGCTKAYGTLNHLNAHVLMQKHGKKRLPEEFKEVRREWRLRKRFNGNTKDDR